jgi:hypothetical protein
MAIRFHELPPRHILPARRSVRSWIAVPGPGPSRHGATMVRHLAVARAD